MLFMYCCNIHMTYLLTVTPISIPSNSPNHPGHDLPCILICVEGHQDLPSHFADLEKSHRWAKTGSLITYSDIVHVNIYIYTQYDGYVLLSVCVGRNILAAHIE